MSDERLQREQEFHDHAFMDDRRLTLGKYYAINRAADDTYAAALVAAVSGGGQDVLEYGCGQGSAAFDLAERGNKVTGIDISPVAIVQADSRATEQGVAGQTTFQVMDAENLDLPSSSFDLVCGSGILHHLDIRRAGEEIARVLRPGGTAVFVEPLGHNPLLNLYRRMTPSMRTPDEHPLKAADFAELRRACGDLSLEFFSLTTLLAVPVRTKSWFEPLLTRLEAIDRRLLSARPLSWQAWCCVVTMTGAGTQPTGTLGTNSHH